MEGVLLFQTSFFTTFFFLTSVEPTTCLESPLLSLQAVASWCWSHRQQQRCLKLSGNMHLFCWTLWWGNSCLIWEGPTGEGELLDVQALIAQPLELLKLFSSWLRVLWLSSGDFSSPFCSLYPHCPWAAHCFLTYLLLHLLPGQEKLHAVASLGVCMCW